MSRTKGFALNSITFALLQLVAIISGFIIPKIMLRYYGSEINGLVASITQFIVYFNLVEIGLSNAATYALYKPLAEKNYKVINGIVIAAKRFYTQAGFIFVSLTIGLAVMYPVFVSAEGVSPLSMGLLVLILGFGGSLEFFTLAKYRVLLVADQKKYVLSLSTTLQLVISTIIIVVLGTMQVDIVIMRFVAMTSFFARSIILLIYVKRKYHYLNYKEEPDFKSLSKRWDALYIQVLGLMQNSAPVLLLTILTRDLKMVSVYAIFNLVIIGINGIVNTIPSNLLPAFGEIIAKGDTKLLQRVYRQYEFFFYGFITVIHATLFVFIMPFIRLYTRGITDVDYNLPIVGFLFVLSSLLNHVRTPQGMLVISAGMFKETRIQTSIQVFIAMVLWITLIPRLGVSGVLIGSIASNIYRGIDLVIFCSRKITKLNIRDTAFRIVRMFIAIGIVTVPMFFIYVGIESYFIWAIYSIIFTLFSMLVTLLLNFIMERNLMNELIWRIKSFVKKSKPNVNYESEGRN